MSNSIGKLTLNDLAGKIFVIPYYQRGYRWTQNEASKLFDDLLEFKKTGEEEYCLQPIVLQRIEKISPEYIYFPGIEGKECLRVVDGQQRLTTISILMHVLGIESDWEIYYIAEKRTLSKILSEKSSELINDHFRNEVKHAFDERNENDKDEIRTLLKERGKSIVFLRYDVVSETEDPEGHEAFLRLNDGKTPLTSSELIRAKYMVNTSGLDVQDQMEISKEWELIENTLREEQFWLMFNSEGLSDTATRMDLLFALVMDVSLKEAKANPRVVFEKLDQNPNWDLAKVWHEVLRCFWWMKSCYADVEVFNYLCWIREFTDNSATTIYKKWRAYPKLENFKKSVIAIAQNQFAGMKDLSAITYENEKRELRKLFVLLNVLDCNKSQTRFRFDLYKKESWDIEHIDSQTPNNLTDGVSQKEWLVSVYNDLRDKERAEFLEQFTVLKLEDVKFPVPDFEEKAKRILTVWERASGIENENYDRNSIGNLALLNTHVNRSYGNAVFPAKRKVIKDFIVNGECYVPPCTAKAFMKFYTESPSKITYWLKVDFDGYSAQMDAYFKEFMETSVEVDESNEHAKDDSSRAERPLPCSIHVDLTCSIHVDSDMTSTRRFSGEVSFECFMDRYQVVIPKIQRLYVQGRLDSSGRKCLSSFASALVENVTSAEPTRMFLDFIYGIDCDEGRVFEPIDGQQRLTTLLLLSWLCGKAKSNWIFRYESRRATEIFVQELLRNSPPDLGVTEPIGKKTCSTMIKQSPWFMAPWEEDPGIAGMLEMLDSLYCKLCAKCRAAFDLSGIVFLVNYLDVNKKSYDQIFLTMNARGKELTDWECVKAVLDRCAPDGKTSEVTKDGVSDWKENLNANWQELLWGKLTSKDINKLDTKMQALVELALRCVGCKDELKNTFLLAKWLENKGNEQARNEFYDLCSIFFSSLEDHRQAIVDALNPIWAKVVQWPDFSSDKFTPKEFYKPLLAYYAAVQSTNANWIRVVWNVVENCDLSKDNFPLAYKLVKELAAHKSRILEFLSGSEKIESEFALEQMQEERLKAGKILSDVDWRDAISEAEELSVLKGRIDVLFVKGGETTLEAFKNALDLLKDILEMSVGRPYYLQKVLLSRVKDPLPSVGLNLQENDEQKKILLTKTLKKCFKDVDSAEIVESDIPWVYDVCSTDLLNHSREDGKCIGRSGAASVVLWGKSGCTWAAYGNVILGNNRSLLTITEGICLRNPAWKVGNTNFVKEKNVEFSYAGHWFRWWGLPNVDDYDIYMLKDNWEQCPEGEYLMHSEGNTVVGDSRTYYGFNIEKSDTPESFKVKLDTLIRRAEAESTTLQSISE